MSRPDPEPDGGRALSYLGLRRGVGFLGLALPVVLIVGKLWVDGGGVQGSISAYYYTVMRDYFVGTQFAMGVFLLCYRYGRADTYLSNVVGASAVGIGLLPTQTGTHLTTPQAMVTFVHSTCATVFFVGMASFLLLLFTRTDPSTIATPQKRQRNVLYRVCGALILACLVLVVVTNAVFSQQVRNEIHPTLWLESVAIWAFAISWLVKGELLFLQDKPQLDSQT